jgi:hypothetical protein
MRKPGPRRRSKFWFAALSGTPVDRGGMLVAE